MNTIVCFIAPPIISISITIVTEVLGILIAYTEVHSTTTFSSAFKEYSLAFI